MDVLLAYFLVSTLCDHSFTGWCDGFCWVMFFWAYLDWEGLIGLGMVRFDFSLLLAIVWMMLGVLGLWVVSFWLLLSFLMF